MSGGMSGGGGNFGMEGHAYKIVNANNSDIEMHWQTYMSEEKQQDSRTSFANCRRFIEMLASVKWISDKRWPICVVHQVGWMP